MTPVILATDLILFDNCDADISPAGEAGQTGASESSGQLRSWSDDQHRCPTELPVRGRV